MNLVNQEQTVVYYTNYKQYCPVGQWFEFVGRPDGPSYIYVMVPFCSMDLKSHLLA